MTEATKRSIFAGFTSCLVFRYSVTFMIHLRTLQITPTVFDMSFFQYRFFRDCGCGKGMSFGD